MNRDGDRIEFTRTAVGKHLLLGGDNLDLTLAWLVESKLGTQLSIRQRSALRRQCAAAKERMLADPNLKSVEITVLGAGSSLVGGTLKTEILREEALELTLEGFLPFCDIDDKPTEEKRSLFRELGLPYVSDPAVTRHLAAFLSANEDAKPDAILFNGGFFIPDICQQRVADVMERWYGRRPADSRKPRSGSRGRGGRGLLLVRQGHWRRACWSAAVSRAPTMSASATTKRFAWCRAAPKKGRRWNSTARICIWWPTSRCRSACTARSRAWTTRSGQILLDARAADLHLHAPLNAVIRFGKSGERLVPVKLRAHLTEVGTLEVWADSKISEHHWRLQFELRKTADRTHRRQARRRGQRRSPGAGRGAARCHISRQDTLTPEELPGKLEQTLALGRNSWPLQRDSPLGGSHAGTRRRPAQIRRARNALAESRAASACAPASDFRATTFASSRRAASTPGDLQFANQVQNEIDWWIFWGRVAGGLNKNQQVDIFQRLSPVLLPRGPKRPRVNNSLLREMWRTGASLELLPLQTKTQLGDALIAQVKKGEMVETGLWCLSRLGARKLFYGPINQVLPAASGDALGGSAAQDPQDRGRRGRHRAPHRRFHARPRARHHRPGSPQDSGSAASRRSKAKWKRISAKCSAKSCRRAWWQRDTRERRHHYRESCAAARR